MFNKFDLAVKNFEPVCQELEQYDSINRPRADWNGRTVVIEVPRGMNRRGMNRRGCPWETKMKNHYGYMNHIEGMDGDNLDVFIGDYPECDSTVYVVDQVDPETREFDEHKAIIYARHIDDAKKVYNQNYPYNWRGLGCIREMTMDEFNNWSVNNSKYQNRQKFLNDLGCDMKLFADGEQVLKRDPVNINALTKADAQTRIREIEGDIATVEAIKGLSEGGVEDEKYRLEELFNIYKNHIGYRKAHPGINDDLSMKEYRTVQGYSLANENRKEARAILAEQIKKILQITNVLLNDIINKIDKEELAKIKDKDKQKESIEKAIESLRNIGDSGTVVARANEWLKNPNKNDYKDILYSLLDFKDSRANFQKITNPTANIMHDIDLHPYKAQFGKELLSLIEELKAKYEEFKNPKTTITTEDLGAFMLRLNKIKLGLQDAKEAGKAEGKVSDISPDQYASLPWDSKLQVMGNPKLREKLAIKKIIESPVQILDNARGSKDFKDISDLQFQQLLKLASKKSVLFSTINMLRQAYLDANNKINKIQDAKIKEAVIKASLLNPEKTQEYIDRFTKFANNPDRFKEVVDANTRRAEIANKLKESGEQLDTANVSESKNIRREQSILEAEQAKLEPYASGESKYNELQKKVKDVRDRLAQISKREKELKQESRNLSSVKYKEYIKERRAVQDEKRKLQEELEGSRANPDEGLEDKLQSEGKMLGKKVAEYKTPEQIEKEEKSKTIREQEASAVKRWKEGQTLAEKAKKAEMLNKQFELIQRVYDYEPNALNLLSKLANEGDINGFIEARKVFEGRSDDKSLTRATKKEASGFLNISESTPAQLMEAVKDVDRRFNYPQDALNELIKAAKDGDVDQYFKLREKFEDGIDSAGNRVEVVATPKEATRQDVATNLGIKSQLMDRFNAIKNKDEYSENMLKMIERAAQYGNVQLFESLIKQKEVPREINRLADKEKSLAKEDSGLEVVQEDKSQSNKIREQAIELANKIQEASDFINSWESKYGQSKTYEEINVSEGLDLPSKSEFGQYLSALDEIKSLREEYNNLRNNIQQQNMEVAKI